MIRLYIAFFLLLPVTLLCQVTDWQTFYESSGRKETPRYQETVDFCRRLDEASPKLTYTSFGKSGQGRDLPLVIADKDGLSDPASIHASGRMVVLIQACIHAGESEGKDAGLMLMRDLAVGNRYPGLLDHLSILFIPIFNTDGHERFGPYNRINQNGPEESGWRVTADNHNLNRDYLKADTPEMQAWLRLFHTWMPDFFIDTHTTDGADYQYVLTYQMETLGEMDENLTAWTKDQFLPQMTGELENAGIPVFTYIEFRKWFDLSSGLITEVAPPMLSQGYTSLLNRPGLLIETHMLKPYDQRVDATYRCLVSSLGILNRESRNLQDLIRKADRYASSPEFRHQDFPLQFETLENDSTMVNFLGIQFERVKSDLTGQYYYRYTGEKTVLRLPFFNKTRPTVTTRLPEAYLIPPQWEEVIRKLELHGIRVDRLKKDTVLSVLTWKLTSPEWQANPYEGRHPLVRFNQQDTLIRQVFPAGTALVDAGQPGIRILAQLLEPKGNGSLLYWGFFDAIFEQKEYAEQYVMEPLAEAMVKKDPSLLDAFEQMKKKDPAFAASSSLMLNWFYNRSPYRDPEKNIYPVGRLYDRKVVDRLITAP
ncbi:MAG TPA: M14 family metallopeptidase [Bacteroidales bacterium]|nr:M14 family metallopeptidase [Bacteroidales bacterium]